MKFVSEQEYVTSCIRSGVSRTEAQRRYRNYLHSICRAQAKDTARLVGVKPMTKDEFFADMRRKCPQAFDNPRNAEYNELQWKLYERSFLVIHHQQQDDSAERDAAIEAELQRRRAEAVEDAAYDREIAANPDRYEIDSSGRRVYPNRVAAKATASASATSASARPTVAVFDPANY